MDNWTADTETWRDRRGYDLSQRIWGNATDLRRIIENILHDAIVEGISIGQLEDQLVRFVDPIFARSGEGKARYSANRLANHEMRRAHALSARDTAANDPSGGYLRFVTSAGHIDPDECTSIANANVGFGRGVYPAKDCPLPPRHIGCRCSVDPLGQYGDMNSVVDALRVEYDLGDPTDLTPAELAIFRRETEGIRQAVLVTFGAWFEQTGIVSQEQLMRDTPTVKQWVDEVNEEKRRRRARR